MLPVQAEYVVRDLLDPIQDACRGAVASRNHAGLLGRLRSIEGLQTAHLTAIRGYTLPQPARVVDAQGTQVAASHDRWLREQLAERGSANAVWRAHKERGWSVTRLHRSTLYVWVARPGLPWAGMQLVIEGEEEIEGVSLFSDSHWGEPREVDDIQPPSPDRRREDRVLRSMQYELKEAVDLERFVRIGQELHAARVQTSMNRGVTVRAANGGVIVSFQQIDTVAADQAVASPMRRLGM